MTVKRTTSSTVEEFVCDEAEARRAGLRVFTPGDDDAIHWPEDKEAFGEDSVLAAQGL